jgi:hypothetical protein
MASGDLQSPYMHGVLTDPDAHRPWLARLSRVPEEDLVSSLKDLPEEWCLDEAMVGEAERLLRSTKEVFIPVFERWIEWERGG